jgi:voltage-gated potassium channel
LIVLSLVSFSVETLPDLSADSRQLLRNIEIFTVSVFTVEYLLRIIVANRKLKFIFSYYGLIDLAAILPFYVATGLDLRSIRVIRLFRLFRALKLLRYSEAPQLFHRAFLIAKDELILFMIAALMTLYLAAIGIYYFENPTQPEVFSSIFSSLWWAVVTLTTVGYGDVYPMTTGGRIFTFFVLLIGVITIAVPSGIVASALGKARETVNDENGEHRS